MALTRPKLKQLEPSVSPGSIVASDTSNNFAVLAPSTAVNHLWGYETSTTATLPVLIGTNLSFDTGTNTLNASAGAGGYSEIQEEGAALTVRTKFNFIGGGITAADDAVNTRTNITLDATLNALAAYNTNGILVQTAADTFAGRTLTGTAARITITNGDGVAGNPTVDVSTSYVGQATITTLGTITTGVWTGTAIAAVNGGTGQTVYAVGDILSANTTTALSRVAAVATGSVLKSAGINTLPVWGTLASTDLSNSANIALLNGTQTFSGINTFSNNITLNGSPSANTDVATVGWVLNNVAGFKSGSVRVATTAILTATAQTATTITLGGTTLTIDGQTMANTETVLVKDSVTGGAGGTFNNGVYVVSGIGTSVVLTRVDWMNTAAEVDGVYVLIQDGTANVGTLWFTVSEVTTLGTDAIAFTQIQTSGSIGGTAAANKVAYGSGVNTLTSTTNFHYSGTQLAIGHASPATSTLVTIQGTGIGNSTFGLKHKNSSTTDVFTVADDGTLVIATGTTTTITGTTYTGTGTLTFQPASGSNLVLNTGNGGTVQYGSQLAWTGTSGVLAALTTTANFAPTSGTATFSTYTINPTINQTGGANGITYGIRIVPSIIAAADYRALDITAGAANTALKTTSGFVSFTLGSDASWDMFARNTSGNLARIANGTTGQVLIATTSATPSWGSVPQDVFHAYITGSTSTTFILNTATPVTDIDGTAINFTVPTNVNLVRVFRNGVRLSRSGTVSRDYTLVGQTLTFASALTADESVLIEKPI